MENYKQKYERVLEQAKQELEACGSLDCDAVRQIFRLFPDLQKSEDELIREELIHFLETCQDTRFVGNRKRDEWIAWLEKQGKQEQLYIRFGEIPTDEKSKIYQGEIEVGTENGVSAYPAFKTDRGDIVLGLSLPITKTALYTQQHLIEYDDRPCYLVKGDYVGKDSDGQPLINNISIIEKINDYRVKEEKQENPTKKVKPKFKVGDFIVHNNSGDVCQVTEIKDEEYCIWPLYAEIEGYLNFIDVDNDYHLWTIQDAKDGDILACDIDKRLFIFKGLLDPNHPNYPVAYCGIDDEDYFSVSSGVNWWTNDNVKPATKEQCDFLFAKMKEASYKWDAEKKELKRIEQNHAYNWNELTWEDIVTLEGIINNVHYEFRNGIGQESFGKEVLERFRETKGDEYMDSCGQNPAWSEEDEEMIDAVIADIQFTQKAHNHEVNQIVYERKIDWLKSLKERLNGTE